MPDTTSAPLSKKEEEKKNLMADDPDNDKGAKLIKRTSGFSLVKSLMKSEDDEEELVASSDADSRSRMSDQKLGMGAFKKDTVVSASSYSNASVSQRFPNAREISETFNTKVFEAVLCLFSISLNIALFVFFQFLGNSILVTLPKEAVDHAGGVVLFLLLIISNIVTIWALNDGSAAYFGALLTSSTGYSLAVTGFQQTPSFFKLRYCNQLSLNSSCRKLLSKLAFLWIALDLLKIITVLPGTAITASNLRFDKGTISCIEFVETSDKVDRKWPTVGVEAGFAELIFGTAIGSLRSERTDVSITTAFMTPQIVGAVADGDTIVGNGFATDILSSCSCSIGLKTGDISQKLSTSDTSVAEKLYAEYNKLNGGFGFANYIHTEAGKITVNTLISGSSICGGYNRSFVSVCQTVFNNHKTNVVEVVYMTDGTPASIAVKSALIRETTGDGDLSWVDFSLRAILEGEYSSFALPSNIPGVLNPLFWWTTPNLLTIDPALLDAGLETTFTILLRAGMQRTFNLKGATCIMNVANPLISVAKLAPYGVNAATAILAIQLIANLITIIGFIPWFLSAKPSGPGVRMIKEPIYFMTLLNSSGFVQGFNELCNAPVFTIWQTMDEIVRVGESLATRADTVGHITMDKPKMVRSLINGKKYY